MNVDTSDAWVEAIRERERLLGKDAVHRMAEMFIEDLDALLSQALEALHNGQTEVARKAIHHLGGNAGCLDFVDLTLAVQDAERACVNERLHEALTQINLVAPLARQKAAQLRRHYRIT